MGLCASACKSSSNNEVGNPLHDSGSQKRNLKYYSAVARNKSVEKKINRDHALEHKTIKLLLLGAGGCGKTTFFKQMQILNQKGFSKEEKERYKHIIYSNIIQETRNLIREATERMKFSLDQGNEKLLEDLSSETGGDVVRTKGLVEAALADGGCKKALRRWRELALEDNYLRYTQPKNMERIFSPDFIPSTEDILFARHRSTGVVSKEFVNEKSSFRLFDVGGQRGERRKWIHCFDNVAAVLFLVSLNDYDLKLEEDNDTNRMVESLNLFKGVTGKKMPWFNKTAFFLFLNKDDLFRKKIKEVDLAKTFPKFSEFLQKKKNRIEKAKRENDGGFDGHEVHDDSRYVAGVEFFKYVFRKLHSKNVDASERKLYIHVTTATDTDMMQTIWKMTRDSILSTNMHTTGFI